MPYLLLQKDQQYEQSNASMKGDGRCVCTTGNHASLDCIRTRDVSLATCSRCLKNSPGYSSLGNVTVSTQIMATATSSVQCD